MISDPYYRDTDGNKIALYEGYKRIVATPVDGSNLPDLVIMGNTEIGPALLNTYKTYWRTTVDNDADLVDNHIQDLVENKFTFCIADGGWVNPAARAPIYDPLALGEITSPRDVNERSAEVIQNSVYHWFDAVVSRLQIGRAINSSDYFLSQRSILNAMEWLARYEPGPDAVQTHPLVFRLPDLTGDEDSFSGDSHGRLMPGWIDLRFSTGERYAVSDRTTVGKLMEHSDEQSWTIDYMGSVAMIFITNNNSGTPLFGMSTWQVGTGDGNYFVSSNARIDHTGVSVDGYNPNTLFNNVDNKVYSLSDPTTFNHMNLAADINAKMASRLGVSRETYVDNSLEARCLDWIYGAHIDEDLSTRAGCWWSCGDMLHAVGPTRAMTRFMMGSEVVSAEEDGDVLYLRYKLKGRFLYTVDAGVISDYVAAAQIKYPTADLGDFPDKVAAFSNRRLHFCRSAVGKAIQKNPAKRTKKFKNIERYVDGAYNYIIDTDEDGNQITMKYLDRRANKTIVRYPTQTYIGYVGLDTPSLLPELPNRLVLLTKDQYDEAVAGYDGSVAARIIGYDISHDHMAADLPSIYDGVRQAYFAERVRADLEGGEEWRVIPPLKAAVHIGNGAQLYAVSSVVGNESSLIEFESAPALQSQIFNDEFGVLYGQMTEKASEREAVLSDAHSFDAKAHLDVFGYPKWYTGDEEGDAAKALAFLMNTAIPKVYAISIQAWM